MNVENQYQIEFVCVEKRLFWEISQFKVQQVGLNQYRKKGIKGVIF